MSDRPATANARLRSGEAIEITTLAERPQLAGTAVDVGSWPEFMRHNRVSEAYFRDALRLFPGTCLVATGQDGAVIADAQAVQLALSARERDALPDGGWEQATIWTTRGGPATTACPTTRGCERTSSQAPDSGLQVRRRAVTRAATVLARMGRPSRS
jgi:hypothetical protein